MSLCFSTGKLWRIGPSQLSSLWCICLRTSGSLLAVSELWSTLGRCLGCGGSRTQGTSANCRLKSRSCGSESFLGSLGCFGSVTVLFACRASSYRTRCRVLLKGKYERGTSDLCSCMSRERCLGGWSTCRSEGLSFILFWTALLVSLS